MADKLTPAERRKLANDALEEMRRLFEDLEYSPDEINEMDAEEIRAIMDGLGVPYDLDADRNRIHATMGGQADALDRGLSLDDAALEALKAKADRALEISARAHARRSVYGLRDAAYFQSDEREWDEQYYMWVSVGEGVCGSCHTLHGFVQALDMWEDAGRPRDGTTLCGANCRCTLVQCQIPDERAGLRVEETRTPDILEPRGPQHG